MKIIQKLQILMQIEIDSPNERISYLTDNTTDL